MAELEEGVPRVFRSAGAMIVLRRSGDTVEAVDGSCFADDRAIPSEGRLQRILDCIAAGRASSSTDWNDIVSQAGRSVRIVDDAIWVCLEQC